MVPLPLPDINWRYMQSHGLDAITLHLIRETARKSFEALDALSETLTTEGLRRVVGLDASRVKVGFMMGGGGGIGDGEAPPVVPILAESGAPPQTKDERNPADTRAGESSKAAGGAESAATGGGERRDSLDAASVGAASAGSR